MNPKEFAEIAGALAWPLTFIAFVAVFYKQVHSLLHRLAETLTVKSIKLKAFGAEVELTPEQARRALDELLQDIAESTNELSADDSALFERIVASAGRETVRQLLPTFQRDMPDHLRLRKLRDRKLIRPFEGGNWQPEKHPVVSRFGQLVYDLRSTQTPRNAG